MTTADQSVRGLCDLFFRPEAEEFIEKVSESTEVSLLAGAGTSIESGFPDWTRLVAKLLRCVASESGLSDRAADDFARWTLSREGLTAAAAVAETCLGDDFIVQLHRALYDQQLTPPAGHSALAIARLVESFGPDSLDVATTNYDLILEQAVEIVLGRRPTTSTGTHRRKANSVLHLHGVMTPRGHVRGQLILSERDYYLMQEDSAWQQSYFMDRLARSTCVFVGASLTDPNLLRYLYRSGTDGPHYAVFVRQQNAGIYDESEPEVIELREQTSETRWKSAGIQPVHADFFSQSAQLLHEVLHRRVTGAARRVYRPLPRRLNTWRRKLDMGILTKSQSTFEARQNDLQEVMRELLGGLRADLADAGHRVGHGERLGLSMWVYDPGSETLTNWASADRVWRDPKTMEPLRVDWMSDFVSVQAFCAGSLVSRSTEGYVATRWNHVIGAPLYIEGERIGRLPVGAVTIASTADSTRSVLGRGLGTLRRVSLPTVEEVLGDLLRP